jgi:hypothetical protein
MTTETVRSIPIPEATGPDSGTALPPAMNDAASPGRRPPTLSGLLRGLGGLVIVSAFLVFLFQGWQDGDDLARCLLLTGHTLILTLAGFAAGHLLHESKGARLFIALALVAIPVNFAFLGSLGYAHLTWDPPHPEPSGPGFWQPAAASLAADLALPLTGAAALVLGVSIWVGFLVMARRSAWPLASLYLLANTGLLLPTRDSGLISGLLLGLGLLLSVCAVGLRRRDPSLATPGGLFARAVLVLPLLIMGGRSIWFHAPDEIFFTTLAAVGYLALRQVLGHWVSDSGWKTAVEWAAVGMAGTSTLFAFATVSALGGLDEVFRLPIAAVLLSGMLFDLSTRATPRAAAYRGMAVLVALAALLVNLVTFGGFASALLCLTGGIATLAYGYTARQLPLFFTGLAAALAGMGFAGSEALVRFTVGGWSGLVLLGVATILAGSLIERHGQRMRAILGRWHQHFSESG